jgi:ribosomal protein S18 acetylase RimI-like enzyme
MPLTTFSSKIARACFTALEVNINNWTISTCRMADLAEVEALVNTAYRGDGARTGWTSEVDMVAGPRTTAADLKDDLAGSTNVSILLLRDARNLVACVRLAQATGIGGKFVCNIGMLAVQPGTQNRGIGRAMLSHAETAARAAGAQLAKMTVVSIRESLIAWYERRGYQRTGETESFPYEEARFGTPLRPDLEFVVLAKALIAPQS